jgi:hypothetical protein
MMTKRWLGILWLLSSSFLVAQEEISDFEFVQTRHIPPAAGPIRELTISNSKGADLILKEVAVTKITPQELTLVHSGGIGRLPVARLSWANWEALYPGFAAKRYAFYLKSNVAITERSAQGRQDLVTARARLKEECDLVLGEKDPVKIARQPVVGVLVSTRDVYEVGAVPQFCFALANRSKDPVTFWGYDLFSGSELRISNRKGDEVPIRFFGGCGYMNEPSEKHLVTIAPGSFCELGYFGVANRMPVNLPGDYRVVGTFSTKKQDLEGTLELYKRDAVLFTELSSSQSGSLPKAPWEPSPTLREKFAKRTPMEIRSEIHIRFEVE